MLLVLLFKQKDYEPFIMSAKNAVYAGGRDERPKVARRHESGRVDRKGANRRQKLPRKDTKILDRITG